MRIVIDIRLLGRGIRSGIEEYTTELVDRLVDSPHRFDLFYNGHRMAPLPPALTQKNTNVIDWHLPNKLVETSMRLFGAPSINADAVFSPHFNFIKTSSPHIMTFHDLSFLHHPDFFSRKQRLWHALQSYKKQAEKAAHVIAVSEFTKSDIINFLKIPPEKISVIYSGISDIFKPTQINNSDFNFPFILYLGTIEPRKNIGSLVRAFNIIKQKPAHRDLRLVIAGSPGWLYDGVTKEANTSPHRDQIIFTGPVNSEVRVLLYNKCMVLAYPSFFEGFGFPPLEAQKCGAPVVASNRTSLPEILGESAILINPWKPDELAAALLEILENENAREKLRKMGLENSARFDWRNSAKQTLRILENAKR